MIPSSSGSDSSARDKNMFSSNPFYILNIPMTANHKEIYSAVDDISLLTGDASCEDSASALISPVRRTSAELDWFPECDEDIICRIRDAVGSGWPVEDSAAEGLSGISRVNADIYNLELRVKNAGADDSALRGNAVARDILSIDAELRGCRQAELLDDINLRRQVAGITMASVEGLADALDEKRSRTASEIARLFALLSDEDNVTLANHLAGYLRDNPAAFTGSVIPELIDRYEIQMQQVIQEQTKILHKAVLRLEFFGMVFDIRRRISGLCDKIENWLRYAGPLMTAAAVRGTENKYCAAAGMDLRELVTIVYKNKNCHSSYKLAVILEKYFAELPSVVKELEKDIYWSGRFLKNIYHKTDEDLEDMKRQTLMELSSRSLAG